MIRLFRTIHLLNKALLLLLFLVGLFMTYAVFFNCRKGRLNADCLGKERPALPAHKLQCGDSGNGALALWKGGENFPLPELKEEILFLSKNTRPDASLSTLNCQIGLKGSSQVIQVPSATALYLNYRPEGLFFSQKKTSLCLKPRLSLRGKDRLELGIELLDEGGTPYFNASERWDVKPIVETKKIEEVRSSDLREGGQLLGLGKWWAVDLLFEQYGGSAFEKYKGKERLALPGDLRETLLHVRQGETFIWKGGRWLLSSETQGFSMAKVLTCDFEKMEWQLWDKEGLESVHLSFKKEGPTPPFFRSQEVVRHVKKRTSTHVSCKIGGQSLLLKEGDWLIHLSNGWRVIKRLSEMEALLHFDLKGELLIFDKIEQVGREAFFCGTLFNETRTHAEPIQVRVSEMKKGQDSPHLKNPLFTKIGS